MNYNYQNNGTPTNRLTFNGLREIEQLSLPLVQ